MMIKYADYIRATNSAYELLIKLRINRTPISLTEILRKLPHVRLKTYSEISQKRNISFNDVIEIAGNKHGFLLKEKRNNITHYIIAYNETKDVGTKRFTIAHELGHIILGHVSDDIISELEANCFARNLLCPVPISIEKRLFTCPDYIKTYHISSVAAEVCLAFRRTDFDNTTTDNYIKITDLFNLSYKDDLAEIEEEIDKMMGIKFPSEYYRNVY